MLGPADRFEATQYADTALGAEANGGRAGGELPAQAPRRTTRGVRLDTGCVVGDYRIVALLGEGGMGRVYEAEHIALGRRVALKQLRGEHGSNREAVRRFFGEARAVNQIAHENIISITDFVEDDDVGCYYIMDLVDGEGLDRLLDREGVPSLERALSIAIQIAGALSAVHRAGIVHRDLKPDNILLSRRSDGSDFVTLLDFGVAKLNDDHVRVAVGTTARGAILGTPEYMSTEQASGKPVDERSDVYSFGVILFELLTGGRPFYADNFAETVARHISEPVPDPNQWPTAPRALPEELAELTMACLQKDPADRIGSMREIELALRMTAESLRFGREAEGALAAALAAAPAVAHPARSRRRPSRWVNLGLAIIAAVVVVACAVGWSSGDASGQPAPVHAATTAEASTTPVAPATTACDTAAPSPAQVVTSKPPGEVARSTPASPRKKRARQGSLRTSEAARRRALAKHAVIDPFADDEGRR